MTFDKLIETVNKTYGDDLVREVAQSLSEGGTGDVGDTLATFIVKELRDTFDAQSSDEEQSNGAIDCLETAQRQLNEVMTALAELARLSKLKDESFEKVTKKS
jgi:hypothetical protein